MTTADLPSLPRDPAETWPRVLRWWGAVFYLIAGLTIVASVMAGEPWAAIPVGVLVLAYALVGHRAAATRNQSQAIWYLVVAIITVGASTMASSTGTFLLFAVFSQIWMLLESRAIAILFSVALAVITTLTLTITLSGGFEVAVLARIAPQVAVGLAFSVGLGLWVAHTMQQNDTLTTLVTELHTTRAQMADLSREAGVTQERERFAREIHDTLAQGFTSIIMLTTAAVRDLDQGRDQLARERLTMVEASARENLTEARALISASAPPGLSDASLAQALHRVAERCRQESGIDVTVEVGQLPALPSATEVVLLRVAQEAVANVMRHSGASRVVLSCGVAAGVATVRVHDDGRGLAASYQEGFGLRGMRERVTAEGGSLRVRSGDPSGVDVMATIPLDERERGS